MVTKGLSQVSAGKYSRRNTEDLGGMQRERINEDSRVILAIRYSTMQGRTGFHCRNTDSKMHFVPFPSIAESV